jgi:uncharacterized protein (DUF58 family)
MFIFTDSGRMVSVLFLCFFLIGYGYGSDLMYMLSFFCLAAIIVSTILARVGARGISLKRELTGSTTFSGDPFVGTIRLTETVSHWRMLEILDQYTNLITDGTTHRRMSVMLEGGRGTSATVSGVRHKLEPAPGKRRIVTIHDEMRFPARGHYRLGPFTLLSYDPFGLMFFKREISGDMPIIVYPRPLPISELVMSGMHGRQMHEAHVKEHAGESFDFHGIRPYVQGDDLRRVHWKSTAHTGKLAIKEFEYYSSGAIQVILDLHDGSHAGAGEQSTLETSVKLAASMLNYAFTTDNQAGLLTTGEKVLRFAPESGRRQLHRTFEALALARADGLTPLAQALANDETPHAGRATSVVITASVDTALIGPLLRLRGRSANVLLVLLDPRSFHDAQTKRKFGLSLRAMVSKPIQLKSGKRPRKRTAHSRIPSHQEHEDLLHAARAAGIDVYPITATVPLHQALQAIRNRL